MEVRKNFNHSCLVFTQKIINPAPFCLAYICLNLLVYSYPAFIFLQPLSFNRVDKHCTPTPNANQSYIPTVSHTAARNDTDIRDRSAFNHVDKFCTSTPINVVKKNDKTHIWTMNPAFRNNHCVRVKPANAHSNAVNNMAKSNTPNIINLDPQYKNDKLTGLWDLSSNILVHAGTDNPGKTLTNQPQIIIVISLHSSQLPSAPDLRSYSDHVSVQPIFSSLTRALTTRRETKPGKQEDAQRRTHKRLSSK